MQALKLLSEGPRYRLRNAHGRPAPRYTARMPRPRQRRAQLHLGVAITSLAACGPAQPLAETSNSAPSTSSSTTGTTTSTPTTSSAPTTTTSTTTTTTTTTDPSTTTITTQADFILKPDGENVGSLLCDVLAQDCREGQKCVPWVEGGGGSWNATKCVDVTGHQSPGEACTAPSGGQTGIDDCEAGAICWDVDTMNIGTCYAQCTGTEEDPQCPPGRECHSCCDNIIFLCYETCEALLQDCDDDAALCVPEPWSGSSYCYRDTSPIEGVANDPCNYHDDCEPGFYCTESATASKACPQDFLSCCQPFCEYPGGPCPNPDQQCRQFYDPDLLDLPPGAEKLGICAIPT